jgi:hypothetical protein
MKKRTWHHTSEIKKMKSRPQLSEMASKYPDNNDLPPILDVIRGISQSEWDRNRKVIELNRPQTRGVRRDPYDFVLVSPGFYSTHTNGRVYDQEVLNQAVLHFQANRARLSGEISHHVINNEIINNEYENN